MNIENDSSKKSSVINFSEQDSEKISMDESVNMDHFEQSVQDETIQEKPKKKFLYGVRSLFSPMPGYGFPTIMKDFWKVAFTDSFAMLKKRTPLDNTTPFQTVLDNWGFSSENMQRTIRIMDVWVILFSIIQILSIILFVWGTQSGKPFFFCLQMFMVVLIPPIPLAVTLWKRDVLRTQVPQSFLHWFRHGFLGLAGIMLCVFWFAMPVGQTLAEGTPAPAPATKFISVPNMVVENDTDLSSQLLERLFGVEWISHTKGVKVSSLAPDVSGVFLPLFGGINTIALAFVSVFLVYIYGAGAVNGAQMGKWTDDQVFSSFWSPVRSSFAVAFCAPLPSGLSLMQVLVMMAIAMSINFANSLKDLVDTQIEKSMVTNIATESIRIRKGPFSKMFNFAVQSAVLTYIAETDEKKLELKEREIKNTIPDGTIGLRGMSTPENPGKFIVSGTLLYFDEDWTGSIQLPSFLIKWVEGENGNADKLNRFGGKINEANKKIGLTISSTTSKMYNHILSKMKNEKEVLTKDKINSLYNEFYNDYAASIDNSIDEVRKAMTTEEIRKDIFEQIKGGGLHGWAVIGTYTFALAHVQGQLTSELNILGTDIDFQNIKDMNPIKDALVSVHGDLAKAENLFNALREEEEARAQEDSKENETHGKNSKGISGVTNITGLLDYASTFLMNSNLGPLGFAQNLKTSNPVTVLTSYGQNLTTAMAWTLTAAGAFLGNMTETKKSIVGLVPFMSILTNGIAGIASAWSPIIIFAIGGIMAFSATCTYILPAIPLIFWMRALFTWLILCIETLVGAPFWAATHALPEGKGFAGQHARRGYLMLLDVMIRPTLLVVGATVSLLVICIVGYFMGTIFEMWANITKQTFGFTFVGIFVMTLILMYITYETCVYIFVTAVGHMPEQVIRWAGGQAGSVGTQEALGQGKGMGGKASEATRNISSGLTRGRK